MKKMICFLLVVVSVLAMAGCKKKTLITVTVTATTTTTTTTQTEPAHTPTPEPTPTPIPTPTPEPSGIPATVMGNQVGLVGAILNQGDTVEIISEDELYYTIQLNGESLLVEKRFVQPATETPFESRKAYAIQETVIHSWLYLLDESQTALERNAEVTVLAEMGETALVGWGDQKGYVKLDQLRNDQPKTKSSTKKNSSDSTTTPASSDGQDGGDIDLSGIAIDGARASCGTNGTIVCDQVEAYRAFLSQGEALQILSTDDYYATVWYNHAEAKVWKWLIHQDDQPAFEAWNGFAVKDASFWNNYAFYGEANVTNLKLNTPIYVMYKDGPIIVVKVDETIGYMTGEAICIEPLEVKKKSKSQSTNTDTNTDSTDEEANWTDPLL